MTPIQSFALNHAASVINVCNGILAETDPQTLEAAPQAFLDGVLCGSLKAAAACLVHAQLIDFQKFRSWGDNTEQIYEGISECLDAAAAGKSTQEVPTALILPPHLRKH